MIKGKFYEAYVVYSEEQAQAYFYKITAKWGAPVIVQQFVRGQEYEGAKDALWWAAMTYVVAALSSLVILIYLLLSLAGNRD